MLESKLRFFTDILKTQNWRLAWSTSFEAKKKNKKNTPGIFWGFYYRSVPSKASFKPSRPSPEERLPKEPSPQGAHGIRAGQLPGPDYW